MSANSSLRLFELSAEFIHDKDKAKEFVTLVETTIDERFNAQTTLLATKRDLSDMRQETTEMGSAIRQEMAEQGSAIRQEMADMGSAIRQEMAEQGSAIRQEMAEQGSAIRQEMAEQGSALRQEMAEQGAKLESKILQVKTDLLKTIYIVNLVQFLAIVGSILAIMNFMLK